MPSTEAVIAPAGQQTTTKCSLPLVGRFQTSRPLLLLTKATASSFGWAGPPFLKPASGSMIVHEAPDGWPFPAPFHLPHQSRPGMTAEAARHSICSLLDLAYVVTVTSTDIPTKALDAPTKLPATGTACLMSRATATGIRLDPPTPRFVGSKVIHPAPGT